MDSDRMFDEGAVFILLNFPKGSYFGIDCHSWVVGDQFLGIKKIPPGWHLISCSSTGKDGDAGSLISFFHKFSAKEIFVKKWSIQSEDFDVYTPNVEEVDRFRANEVEVDRHLGPYPLDSFRKWLSLSNFVDDNVVAMLMPPCGYIFNATQFLSEKQTFSKTKRFQTPANDSAPANMAQAEARLPQLLQDESSAIKYSVINRRSFEPGATPTSISINSMDSSYHLESVIHNRFKDDYRQFLGELQFAFLSFLVCQNYDSFEHWKKTIELVCCCDKALGKCSQFYMDFLKTFYYQLKEVPSDFFVDIVSSDNFLTVTLHRFFSNVDGSSDVPAALKSRVEKFRRYVTEQFKWDFGAELPEDQPIIVDAHDQ